MSYETFDGFSPRVDPRAWVHPSAILIGEVELKQDSSVWPLSVLRGDNGRILIGERTNVQDGTICHATKDRSHTTVGTDCTIGHRVMLHGCTVGDWCLIGMGSTLLDNAEVGAWSLVAAGSLIPPGRKFEPRSFIVGAPARRIREVSDKEIEMITYGAKVYCALALKYAKAGTKSATGQ